MKIAAFRDEVIDIECRPRYVCRKRLKVAKVEQVGAR